MENDTTLKIGQAVWATCNELRRRCTIIGFEPGRVEVEDREKRRFKVPTTDIVPCMTTGLPVQEYARKEMATAKHHLDLAKQLAKPDPVPASPRKRRST